MKKNKENLAQKYFSQKSDLWLDVLAISLVVLGIFIYIFGFKISFIGIPMVFAGVIFKAVDLFVYIKDKEFDDHINYLKETNDRYGHDVGNKLIVSAAHIISETYKRSPVFRIGGDEFLVILQNRDLEEYEVLLEKIDEECRNVFIVTDRENIPVSIAKGFARYNPEKDTNFMDVFNRADDAMYENKREIKRLKQ